MQKEHTFTVDGLINGGGLYPSGLISGIICLKMDGLISGGGLKSGILRYFRIYLEGLMRTRL